MTHLGVTIKVLGLVLKKGECCTRSAASAKVTTSQKYVESPQKLSNRNISTDQKKENKAKDN